MSALELARASTWELVTSAEEIVATAKDARGMLDRGHAGRGLEMLYRLRETVSDLQAHFEHAVHHASSAEAAEWGDEEE